MRVDLVRKCDGAPLTAITTHLSSGTKDKDRAARINECSAPSVDANGALTGPSLREWISSQTTPTLLCVDTNEPPLPKITDSGGDSQGDNTVWSILRNGDDVRSVCVWDDYFHPDGSPKNPRSNVRLRTSGLKWKKTGATKPTQGRELSKSSLAEALKSKTEFSQEEWRAFGLGDDLRPDDYIKTDDVYFRPIVRKFNDVRSVWDDYFNPDGSHKIRGRGHTLVTTNKMRGPLSDQPDKIGEHAFAAIDHIFYGDGSQTGALDAWRLSLLGHTWQPLEYPSRDAALRHILPSLEVPSDHAPVIVDMLLVRARELPHALQETRNASDERGALALRAERLVVLHVDDSAVRSGHGSGEAGRAMLNCGTITAVDQAGIFHFKVDNGPALRMPGLEVTCYTCGSVCHKAGTKLLVHADDGGIVDATVVSPPTYEKEVLSNQHKLVIAGKDSEDAGTERAFDLNEFNHCCSPELSAKEFDELRQSFCKHVVSRDQMVQDAITGNQQHIEHQVLELAIVEEKALKDYTLPDVWKAVKRISDFERILLSSHGKGRTSGAGQAHHVLLRAGAGTGKTWSALQLNFLLAKSLANEHKTKVVVPLLIRVQRLVRILRTARKSGALDLITLYIDEEYKDKDPKWHLMLSQALQMRALVLIFDGIDEASGRREIIEDYIMTLVPLALSVVATSRPEGVRIDKYRHGWVVMDLERLSEKQMKAMVSNQLEGSHFFQKAMDFVKIRKEHDAVYVKAFTSQQRQQLENLSAPNLLKKEDKDNPEIRQMALVHHNSSSSTRDSKFLLRHDGAPESSILKVTDAALRARPGGIFAKLDSILDASHGKVEEQLKELVATTWLPAMAPPTVMAATVTERLCLLLLHGRKKQAGTGKNETAEGLWQEIIARTDELYVAAEAMQDRFKEAIESLAPASKVLPSNAKDASAMAEVLIAPFKDPVRIFEKAGSDYGDRFKDEVLPEANILDVLRSSIICTSAEELIAVLEKLKKGFTLKAPDGDAPEFKVSLARMKNKANPKEIDPTHFRNVLCNLKLECGGLVHYGELQVHHRQIRQYNEESHAHDVYEYFRTELGGSYGPVLNKTLERTILFLEEASGVPVLLSMLVLVFEMRGQKADAARREGQEVKANLPKTRMELYQMAIRGAIAKTLNKNQKEADIELADQMLSRVAVANMEAKQRREFNDSHVREVLEEQFPDEWQLWVRLQQDGELPLIKVLTEGDAYEKAEFQFAHLSFQEAFFALHLKATAASWPEWDTDADADHFMSNPSHDNTCRIGGDELGSALACRRPSWDLSSASDTSNRIYSHVLNGASQHLQCLRGIAPALVTTVISFLASSPTLDELGFRGLKKADLHQVELGLMAGLEANCRLQRLDVGENEADTNGLLMACKAGNLKLCESLLQAKADVSARDKINTSPLVAASGAGVQRFKIREALIKAGADSRATRYDGASNLSLAIMSREKRDIAVAIEALELESEHWHGSRLCNGWRDSSAGGCATDDTMSAADVQQLASPYLQTSALSERLLHGASPLAIKGEIGALLAALEAICQDMATGQNLDALSRRLDRARSFLDHHSALLQEPPVPIEQAVAQLFAQEPAGVFERSDEGRPAEQGAANTRVIGWVNQPSVTRPCRWTLEGREQIRSVAYSSDGRRLARAEGNDVVICCAVSGIELSRLLGHRLTCMCCALYFV